MELTLTRQAGTQVLVTCDDQSSHTFDLLALVPGKNGLPHPLDDPITYGKAIFQALFLRSHACSFSTREHARAHPARRHR